MSADSRAHAAVHAAVAGGLLKPAGSCECHDCGRPAAIHHHYLGYDPTHWLDVVPLCRRCHRFRHPPSPRIPGAPEVAVTIRFKQQLVKEIRALAEEENRSINGTVIEAVERYIRLRRGRKPQDEEPGDGR